MTINIVRMHECIIQKKNKYVNIVNKYENEFYFF